MLRYSILGPVELFEGAERRPVGGRRQRALFADLLVHANATVSDDRLIDDLWGSERSEGSIKALQMRIARLRKALGAEPLERTPTGYRLVVAPGELDADVFDRCVEEAGRALRAGDPAGARERLRAGLALWRGPPLADVAYETFAQDAIRRLEERRIDALETYAEADLALGDHADVISRLAGLVDVNPERERLTFQLMVALYHAGRQQDALDAYQRTRKRLDEHGLEPGSALVRLQRQILTHDAALAGAQPELPPPLRALPECVGRRDERAELREAIAAARGGARAIVCIGGEPGMGKTLLAGHAALEAHGEGFAVGWGASLERVRPPYGAWIAPLSQLAARAPAELINPYRERLAHITGSADAQSRSDADPEGERYRVFDAVAGALRQLSAMTPTFVGLDDLQWADSDSLALLHYVASEPVERFPLAIVATYRESELDERHPLRDLLPELYRVPGVTWLKLDGLGAGDVATLMAARSEHAVYGARRRLVEEITEETGGNPFFVGEILHHLDESPAPRSLVDVRLPRSVSEVVGRRVRRLGDPAQDILRAAAVIGHDFAVDLLERLVRTDPLGELEAAEAAALLRSTARGRYAFAHALINHTLYDQLSPTRRALLHSRVADELEDDPDADPATLAHHCARSGVPAQERRAAVHAREAGERALARLAPEEAQRWFAEALHLLLAHGGDESERCDVLIGLGEAKRRSGDATFRYNLLKSARVAARDGDLKRLTRAVLANTLGPFGAAGGRDRLRIDTLERALAVVPEDWPERPLMTAVLARELYYSGDAARGSQLSMKALVRARRRSDRLERARVMAMATAISPIAPLDAHQKLVDELLELADELNDPELRFRAANAAFIYGMHSGDPVPLAAGLTVMRALDDDLRQPILHWTRLWADSAARTLAGDLAGGEKLTTEAELHATRHGRPQAQLITFGQLLSIRTEQAALDDLRERLAEQIAANPHLPVLRLARGFIDAETGHLDEALTVLRRAAVAGFPFPFDRTLAFSLARCADIALRVRERAIACDLYDRLLPFREQFATPAGLSSRGSVELSLGRLATMLGRFDAAEDHVRGAQRAHEHLGAPLLQARSSLAWGEALLARGSRERAHERLDCALRLARAHGSVAIAREAQALRRSHAQI
jgi:DNA-binding SARP family transcriptional activator